MSAPRPRAVRRRPSPLFQREALSPTTGVFARPLPPRPTVAPAPDPPPAPEPRPPGGFALAPAQPFTFAAPSAPALQFEPELERARSHRTFAVLAGLIAMVCLAMVGTVGLTVAAVIARAPRTADAAAAPPPRRPVARPGDTGDPGPPPELVKIEPERRQPVRTEPVRAEPEIAAPATGPAPVEVAIPDGLPFSGIEVSCPISGFRQRAPFASGTASLPAVPLEDCTVSFTGGPPARNTIRGGQHKRCTFPNDQAVCQ